jgi:hypothetical protein
MRGMGSTLGFAAVARALSDEARNLGLETPGFRSPPRRSDVDRSVRRRPGHPPAVAVRIAGRPLASIAEDMVEGVVVANHLAGVAADEVRNELRRAVAAAVTHQAA